MTQNEFNFIRDACTEKIEKMLTEIVTAINSKKKKEAKKENK